MANSVHFLHFGVTISHNLMAFHPIWVGFSLKIIILIGEHCYTDFNVKNQNLKFWRQV